MKRLCGFLLLSAFLVLQSCQKEYSLETGGSASVGSLQSNVTGDCLPKTVAGSYEAGTTLDGALNFIEVSVDVTETGAYTIYTDTVNGIFFRATGMFASTGVQTLKLKGAGTPFDAGIHNFVVTYGGSTCVVAVTTLPAGAGGPAAFTLVGGPGACNAATVQGTYISGTPVGGANSVILNVNVTTIGTYTITTTASNGMTFSGTGTLGATGPATITLAAGGTPVAPGTTNIPVTAGASTCSFDVVVSGPATYTINCAGSVANGTYETGTALDGTNTIDLNVNVGAPGAYDITGSINGMTFTSSGTFTATGVQTIQLAGSGTPAAAGDFQLPLSGGTAACNVDITVDDATTGQTSGTFSLTIGATTYAGTIDFSEFDNSTLPGILLFYFEGITPAGDLFGIELGDLNSVYANGEIYNMASPIPPTTNIAAFGFQTPTMSYEANPTLPTNTMTVTLTTHNTATKTMTGTFSGQALDQSGNLTPITAGSFTVTYP